MTYILYYRHNLLLLTASLVLLVTTNLLAQEAIEPPHVKAPATEPSPAPDLPGSFESSGSLSEYFLGKHNAWDDTYDAIEAAKKEAHLPISIGANHWFHIDRDERIYGNGYGVPTESGTYYWYIAADPEWTFSDSSWLQAIGAHAQFRFRDDKHDKLRPFYYNTYWFYEAYAYVKTSFGTFKAGQIVTEFGLPWDGTWWEGVPYFDGYKFDPDYGLSWDKTWKANDRFSLDSAVQYFIASDRVNGSIQGADAESAPGGRERNTGVVRLVPTWQFNSDTKLAWGVSGLFGGIHTSSPLTDDTRGTWGTDATFTYRNLSVFAEYIDGYGITNPQRYVSGGPSDHVNSLRGGVAYKYGPATFHVNYSRGWDHNPSGHQFIFDPGASLQVTKNVTFYCEYVKWDVTNHSGQTAKFDDGFELIAVWNL
jgi:hypothetical protein